MVGGQYRVRFCSRETQSSKTQWLGDNRESDSVVERHPSVSLSGRGDNTESDFVIGRHPAIRLGGRGTL